MTPPPSLGGHRPALALLGRIANGETSFFPRNDSAEARTDHAELVPVLERLADWGLISVTPRTLPFSGAAAHGAVAELTDRGRLYASLLPPVRVLTDSSGRRWACWEEESASSTETDGECMVLFCSGATVRRTQGPAGITAEPEALAGLWIQVA